MKPPKFKKPKPKPGPLVPKPGGQWGRFWRRGRGPQVVIIGEPAAEPQALDFWWYFDAWSWRMGVPRRQAFEGPVRLHDHFDARRHAESLRDRTGAALVRAFRFEPWRGAWVREQAWEGGA